MSQDVLLVYLYMMYVFQVTKNIAEASFFFCQLGTIAFSVWFGMPGSRETADLIHLSPQMFIECLLHTKQDIWKFCLMVKLTECFLETHNMLEETHSEISKHLLGQLPCSQWFSIHQTEPLMLYLGGGLQQSYIVWVTFQRSK